MLMLPCSYLKSPIIELAIGSPDAQTLLFAHQGLLKHSPWFESNIAEASV